MMGSNPICLATWNVNSLRVRLEQVLAWLQSGCIDVLALQEIKLDQHEFPKQAFAEIGYQAVWFSQKTYNGVAIVARSGMITEQVRCGIPGYSDPQRRVIAVDIQNRFRLINAYVVNGESLDSDKFIYKCTWLEQFSMFVRDELQRQDLPLVVVGDFNIAPTDLDVYDPDVWKGSVLCSDVERAWFSDLLDLGLVDSLRVHHPGETGLYTWWDYRGMRFRRRQGLRIDHILVDRRLHHGVRSCDVDVEPRQAERPSDHAPVLARFCF